MGDIADFILEQYGVEDPDGIDELRVCPKCGHDDCFVDVKWRINCPKCGYKGD